MSNELSNIGPLFGRGTTGYEHVTSWRMALLGGVSDAKTALCLLWQARFSRLLVHTYLPAPAKAPPRRAKTCDVRGGAALVLHEEGILQPSLRSSGLLLTCFQELPMELPSRGSLGPPDEAMRAGFCRRPLLVPAFGHTIAAPDQLRLGADAEGGAAATDWAAVRWFPAPRGLRGAKVRRRLRRLHGQRSVRDDAVNKEVALSQQALRALSIAHGTAKRLR